MKNYILSPTRIKRIRAQGYQSHSDQEIRELAIGNRFAYQLCTSFLAIGIFFANIPLLLTMMSIAFMSIILPYHPFDYIYNLGLSKLMNKPALPPRSVQLKFACSMATLNIGLIVYLFYSGMMMAGYILGALFLVVALLVSTIDFCIPSIIIMPYFLKCKPRLLSKIVSNKT